MDYRKKAKFEWLAFKGGRTPDGPQEILEKQIVKLSRQERLKWIVVVVLFLLTAAATYLTFITGRQRAIADFDKAITEVSAQFERRVSDYTNALLAMKALFSASVVVEKNEFRNFYNSIRQSTNLPGLVSVSYISQVPNLKLAPVVFVEPSEQSAKLLGVDVRSNEDTGKLLDLARDTGTVIVSPLTKLNETSSPDALQFFQAIYKNGQSISTKSEREAALVGFVSATVLIDGILGDTIVRFVRENDLSIEIFKQNHKDEASSSLKVYSSQKSDMSQGSPFKRDIDFKVGQMIWTMRFTASPFSSFFSEARSQLIIVFCAGTLFSLIVSYLLLSSFSSRRRLLTLAKGKTRDVEEVNQLLRKILDTVPAPILLKNEDLQVLIWNRAFEELTGIEAKEILGLTGYESFPADELDGYFEVDRAVLESQELIAVEETITTKWGEKKTILTKKVPIGSEPGKRFLLGISEDITAIRRGENSDKKRPNYPNAP